MQFLDEASQVKFPGRATARTTIAAVIGLLPILPTIAHELGIESIPWVAGTLAVTAAITRILATPAVEKLLQTYAPWLAADPRMGRHRKPPMEKEN